MSQVSAAAMLKEARALEGAPYVYGGGHSKFEPVAELKKFGLDCSAYVSAILHAGGVKLPGPQDAATLPSYLQKGKGTVTVYDRPTGPQAHTLINIHGRWFEEGGNPAANPTGGAAQLTPSQAKTELSGGGFQAFHPAGAGGSGGGFLGIGDSLANTAGGIVNSAGQLVDSAGHVISGGASTAEQVATDPAKAVENAALGYVEPRLEKGALYAALIIGGVGLAGYGLVRMFAPLRPPSSGGDSEQSGGGGLRGELKRMGNPKDADGSKGAGGKGGALEETAEAAA